MINLPFSDRIILGARCSAIVEALSFWLELKMGRYEAKGLFLSTLNKILRGCSSWAVRKGSSVFGG